eukprot:1611491-Prymnesium_polylepis.1
MDKMDAAFSDPTSASNSLSSAGVTVNSVQVDLETVRRPPTHPQHHARARVSAPPSLPSSLPSATAPTADQPVPAPRP